MTLLSGIRVLDLSLQLPGPFCTMMMADYGADVVKIDEPEPRVRNPFAAEDPGTGPLDRYLNRGKKSVTLNLKSAEGREIFRKMAAIADVVVEGFRPGVVKRLGVEYETLSAANPGLVYCSISGYGQTGPMRDVAGHDVNYLSYAGVLGLSGRPSVPPTLLPVQVGDVYGGSMMALSGILMALLSRQRTGKGAWIDISMTDGSIASLAIPASNLLGGGIPQERGALPLAGMLPCYDAYRCADGGYVSLGALEPWFWRKLVTRLGREDFGELQYAVGETAEEVRRDLQSIFLAKTRDEWIRHFEGEDVCISPVLPLDEALSHPNTLARRMVVDVGSPLGGTERQLGFPIKIAEEEERAPGRAPRLGEHDDQVLAELGYSGEEIAGLRAKGVIRKGGTP
jgi:crotonobetainyl-CoA:carnitine CoA-transferase CaiB-like acyl-CoA transferase